MIKEEKIKFTAKWCKYSKYIIEKKDDKYYIFPDKNAKPSTYDPFEVKNQILKDLLVIGKESVGNEMFKLGNKEVTIEAQSKMEKFQNLVFEFVSNYGLLGNFRYLPENYEFMDNGDIPVNLGYNTSISALEFEKKYFWKDSKIDWSNTMKANDYHRNTGLNDDFEQIEGDRLNDVIFSKNYAETIAEIINFATIIYNKKLLICAYLYDDVSEDIRQVYQESITGDSLKKPNISYSAEDGQIKFKWNFMSLSEIIETILLLNETSGRTEVKLCKHCGKPFIAENIKSEYDTIQCRNRENINKSRQKKNNYIE
ncbi:putative uncharacterized protein [Clostridium sp. CAG:492]|nr:putative uncharacterized protein [Clostridium sp. CAG:492]